MILSKGAALNKQGQQLRFSLKRFPHIVKYYLTGLRAITLFDPHGWVCGELGCVLSSVE
jgi:hypothetical protein